MKTQTSSSTTCRFDVRGKVVRGDALFAHPDLSLQIAQAHGDYLLKAQSQSRLAV